MKDKILVVGGYGQVGKVICRGLGKRFPGKIIAAGRNYKKAKKFSQATKGNVLSLEFDLFGDYNKNNLLEEVFAVVMCVDQKDTQFVETCLKKGIHYIDITASYSFLSKVESLHNVAKSSGATAILSVGLTPGLTNLLVKHSKSHFDVLDRADISVMLGLGEEHGKAAIEWMIDNINTVFKVVEDDQLREVQSFVDGKITTFPKKFGKRMAYRFGLAEQHILPKTLDISTVSNRVCFASKFITKSLVVLKKVGFFNLLKIEFLRNIIVELFSKFNLGSEVFSAKVDAVGKKDGKETKFECSVLGNNQSRITGQVAQVITEYIYTTDYSSGVYHIEEIFDLQDILDQLSESIRFYSD
ncbi:hypothetical protein JCM16358_03300 [Halanaerocella petrolearia]